eukprot:756662-Hanusia_phi.AAC.5
MANLDLSSKSTFPSPSAASSVPLSRRAKRKPYLPTYHAHKKPGRRREPFKQREALIHKLPNKLFRREGRIRWRWDCQVLFYVIGMTCLAAQDRSMQISSAEAIHSPAEQVERQPGEQPRQELDMTPCSCPRRVSCSPT